MSSLVDGAAYFAAVRSAISRAKRSVYILGWDFDSRIQLVPGAFSAAERQELDIALAAIPIRGARLSPPVLAATGVEAPPKR